MGTVVSFRMGEPGLERLRRAARAMGRSPGEAAAVLVEEGLRLREFPGLEFRETPVGRQAYLRGSRLGVWQVAEVVAAYAATADSSAIEDAADHLAVAPAMISLALAYARAYPDEVAAAAADLRALNERLLATAER